MSALKRGSGPPPPPQWVIDINSEPLSKPKTNSLPDPPGYPTTVSSGKKGNKQSAPAPPARKPLSTVELETLKLKKAWEVALAPAKQLPMNAIGMWMTGNSLQIFSIFMVFTLFRGPIQALLNINHTFARFDMPAYRSQLTMVKLAYVGCNLLALGLGIYKVDKMGLLPTTRSDWLAWETAREPLERAFQVV